MGGERVFLKMVTYGPFPEPRPESVADDGAQLTRIAEAGFNAVRVYTDPTPKFLEAAEAAELWVFVGLSWQWWCDFISKPSIYTAAQMALHDGLKTWGGHPAVAGVFVGNEIPADLVRWMGGDEGEKGAGEAHRTRPESAA